MRAGLVGLVLGLVAVGCGGSGSGEAPRLLVALCDAVAASPAEAAGIFDRDAHGPLHELAARVAERDRRAAARLLQAKNAVERAADEPGADLQPRLDELVAATRDALVAVGSPAPPCPTGEGQP